MKKKLFIQKRGFTLVELVVVMAIFGVLFTVVSNTFINSLKAASKAEATKNVRQNADVALARMSYDIKQAQTPPTCPSATRIVFTAENGLDSEYFIDSNQLMRLNGTQTDGITDPTTVRLQNVSFTCPTVGQVNISFDLQYLPFGDASLLTSARNEDLVQLHFQTTVVNRNVD